MWPRNRGFVASIKALRSSSSINAVYDLTIAYAHEGRFHEAPSFTQSLFDPDLDDSWRFHVHAERFDMGDFADKTDTELAQWLEDRWMAKSAKLQELQQLLEEGKEWQDVGSEANGSPDGSHAHQE